MTYCSSLCESSDLGTTIEALLTLTRAPRRVPAIEAVDADLPPICGLACPRCGGDLHLDDEGHDACIECGARIVAVEDFRPRRQLRRSA